MKKITIVLMCICTLGTVWAQTISLHECIDIALKNNADVQKQSLELEQVRKNSANQWNHFLPSISVSGSYGNNGHVVAPTQSSGNWKWGAAANASLTLQPNIPVQIQIATLDYEIAQHSYAQLVREIEIKVAAAYYQLLQIKENIVALEDSVMLAKDEYEQVKKRYNAGVASELDLLRSQYSYESAGPELRETQSNYTSAVIDFLILLGVNAEGDKHPNESRQVPAVNLDDRITIVELVLPSLDELITKYLADSPDILSKFYALEKTKLNATSLKVNSYAPSLTLSENLAFIDPITGDYKINGNFSISARLPIENLIPGSKANLSIKQTKVSITSAEIDLETATNKAQQNIYKRYTDIERLWTDISAAKLNFSIAKRTYELSHDAYENGLLNHTDLESARQNFTKASIALTNAEIAYIYGNYELAKTLNIDIYELYDLYGKSSIISIKDLPAIQTKNYLGDING